MFLFYFLQLKRCQSVTHSLSNGRNLFYTFGLITQEDCTINKTYLLAVLGAFLDNFWTKN